MAPMAVDTPEPPPLPKREEKSYPPANIFNVKETRFEKPVPTQTDGRAKALAQPDGAAAIVIDNGKSRSRLPSLTPSRSSTACSVASTLFPPSNR